MDRGLTRGNSLHKKVKSDELAIRHVSKAILHSRVLSTESKRSDRTVELMRRRESKHPSPHQASCEKRSRRSRPMICYVAGGSGTFRSRQIFRASKSLISLCRGTVDEVWVARLTYTVCFFPSRKNSQP